VFPLRSEADLGRVLLALDDAEVATLNTEEGTRSASERRGDNLGSVPLALDDAPVLFVDAGLHGYLADKKTPIP